MTDQANDVCSEKLTMWSVSSDGMSRSYGGI